MAEMTEQTPPGSARGASPAVAAILSFLLPGLGQSSVGRVRRGVLVAIPALAVPIVAVAIYLRGRAQMLGFLLSPGVLEALLAINVALAAYHVLAIVDAHRLARRQRGAGATTRASAVILAVILLTTVALHGAIEGLGYQAYGTISAVFLAGGGEGLAIPAPSFDPTPVPTPAPTPEGSLPTATPEPTPTPGPAWAQDGRLNVLLIGADAGPGRWSLRTDSMEVLSIDVASGRAALFGFPRNETNVPLPPESAGAFPGGRYPGLLNSLFVYANGHPDQFPGGDARGFRAVSGAIQELIGMPLDGVVVVDLNGFVRLVNAIGGLWIDIPSPVYDDAYPLENGTGDVTLYLKAGCQHLNGHFALAYARTRHQDSDYNRMGRQQLVLNALAHQVDPIALLPKIPELLSIAKDDLWTTFSTADAADLAALADRVDRRSVQNIRFIPPQVPEFLTNAGLKVIQDTVRHVFDGPAPTPAATTTPGPTSTSHCG
jgi:LCP family protein required for cell wall assembly